MEDKFYLESLLTECKALCNLLFTATTESSNAEVHHKFQTGLNVCLEWQNAIFKHMEQMGYYKQENVEKQAISKEQASIEPLELDYQTHCR